MKNKKFSKIALSVSLILIVVWLIIGTTSSVAWFKEEDTLINSLNFGSMEVKFYYKDGQVYKDVDMSTEIFSSDDLYEPGFTHITYLKVVNAGTIPFTYDFSVVPIPEATEIGTSVLGTPINLADYIKFGLVTGSTEKEVALKVQHRDDAIKYAVNDLSNYSQSGGTLQPGETGYAALVVYMPSEVGNAANYRGNKVPRVGLSIAAIAKQIIDE